MPFESLGGTFNRSQFERLAAFCRAQSQSVADRIRWLSLEQIRVGVIVMRHDGGTPIGYLVSSSTSYVGKLVACYEVLGGDVLYDLQVRLAADPVYLMRGDESESPTEFSNGEVLPSPGLNDSISSDLVQSLKEVNPTSTERLGYLERKIRRTLDYVDQLQAEIDVLKLASGDKTVEGSVEFYIDQIEQLFTDTSYRAIFDDNGKDPFGRKSYAPFAPYEPGPTRPNSAAGYQRGNDGLIDPGDSDTNGGGTV